jgi:tRNA threonylcarbamoyladenosine biosynthesis protein TsaB
MIRPLLAFDTSTDAMAIGVDGPHGYAGWNGPGGARASTLLLPTLRGILARQSLAIGDLAAVAFGAGPGAFTGLRTACSVAQGLALGAGVPVLPVDSLMIVAEDARLHAALGAIDDIGVAMDARMGEIYAARYRWDGRDWLTTTTPALVRPDELADAWRHDGPPWLAGTGVELLHGAWPEAPPGCALLDRAQALVRLARRLHVAGAGVDASAGLPIYLRDKVAQTIVERAASAAAVEATR